VQTAGYMFLPPANADNEVRGKKGKTPIWKD